MPGSTIHTRVPDADASSSRIRRRVTGLVIVGLLGVAAIAGIVGISRTTHPPVASETAAGDAASAELRVSRDFGATTLAERRLRIPPSSNVMGLLAANAKVQTAYGGGFVNAIDGVASGFTGTGGVRADWFYFVNGIQADRGAADYRVSDSDRVWWDYHRWDFAPSVPAVVGQFPQPFLSGAGRKLPTAIEYEAGFSAQAAEIASDLRSSGVASASVSPLDPAAALPTGRHLILVGTWRQLASNSEIAGDAAHPAGSGLFARLEHGQLVTLDALGHPAERSEQAGLVEATARGEDPGAALWLVTGSDAADVASAVGLLGHGAPRLAGRFGVAVLRDGSTIALPTEPSR